MMMGCLPDYRVPGDPCLSEMLPDWMTNRLDAAGWKKIVECVPASQSRISRQCYTRRTNLETGRNAFQVIECCRLRHRREHYRCRGGLFRHQDDGGPVSHRRPS